MRLLTDTFHPLLLSILVQGAVAAFTHALRVSFDNTLLAYVSGALCNLAMHEGSRPVLVAEGVVEPLATLCGKCQDGLVLSHATQALVNVALHAATRERVVQEGAVRPLVQLCTWSQDATVLCDEEAVTTALEFPRDGAGGDGSGSLP